MKPTEALKRAQMQWGATAWVRYDDRVSFPYIIMAISDGQDTVLGCGNSWEEAFAAAERFDALRRDGLKARDATRRRGAAHKG